MEIRQIRYVEAVSRYSNFSKAAEEMFVTQQTLSQQVKRLEEEIGFSIFERSTRTVSLTGSGKQFVEKAIPLLKMYDQFNKEIEELRENSVYSIRLGILPTFSHLNVLEMIYDFQAQEKEISVQVQIQKSSRLVDMIDQGSLDMAIGNLSQQQINAMQEDNCLHVLSKDHICAVLHEKHPIAQSEDFSLPMLEGQILLLLEKGSSIRNRMEAVLDKNRLKPAEIISCPEIHSMIGMLYSGVGIGFMSSQVATKSIAPPLKRLPVKPEMETLTALYYRKVNEKAEIMEKLSNFLRNHV